MDTPGLKSGARDVVLAEIGRNLTLSSSLRLIYPLRIQFLHPCKKCGGIIEIFFKISAPRPDGFFFSETSGRPYLTARELCSVESAAKHHVNNTIHVVMASPHVEWSGPLKDVSKEYPNVFFRHVDFESLIMR